MSRATSEALLRTRLIAYQSLFRAHRGYLQPDNYIQCVRRPFFNAATIKPKPMHIRRVSAAILAGVVSYRAWHFYHEKPGLLNTGSTIANSESQSNFERRASIVGSESLHTEVIHGNEPISKEKDVSGKKILEIMNPEQATKKLRRNEESYFIGRGNGVVRYDLVQIPSNDPIEDDHAEKIIHMPNKIFGDSTNTNSSTDWMFWGVFDGHSGWTTSAKLRQALINFVARELNTTYQDATANESISSPSNEAIHTAIKTGFLRLDDEIVNKSVEKTFKANSKLAAAELLSPALSGSCALLSFYDSSSKLLHVACTGDSRAILGRRGDTGKWAALPLSTDQTGNNPDEEARIHREHPGENVIRNGRVLGSLEPTRAFGDAIYKWSREISERIKSSFFGRTPSKLLQTPPYVTAEPVVTTTQIYPEKYDFLIMATDGLWEMLSNEEVVGLVGKWIEKQESNSDKGSWMKILKNSQNDLPVEHSAQTLNHCQDGSQEGQKAPIRQQQWGIKGESKRFVVHDKNVATHLVRNALGGNNTDMVCALLSLPAPYSRRYRDDLTVQVIFFGVGEKSGEVTVNKEASAALSDVKAKM